VEAEKGLDSPVIGVVEGCWLGSWLFAEIGWAGWLVASKAGQRLGYHSK
jgi:hypothetical protein